MNDLEKIRRSLDESCIYGRVFKKIDKLFYAYKQYLIHKIEKELNDKREEMTELTFEYHGNMTFRIANLSGEIGGLVKALEIIEKEG